MLSLNSFASCVLYWIFGASVHFLPFPDERFGLGGNGGSLSPPEGNGCGGMGGGGGGGPSCARNMQIF